MAEIGQLQPILVTPDHRLIAGGRRLAAATSLGWSQIEAKVIRELDNATALLQAERDENTCRKAFTPTEEYSLYAALLALESERNGGDVPSTNGVDARTKQSVAEIVTGVAGRHRSLEKIGEIQEILRSPTSTPRLREVAEESLRDLDMSGNISGAYRRVMLARKAAASRGKDSFETWSDDERRLHRELAAGRTVVVSYREVHANLTRWALAEGLLVGIDRRTEWGNPFELPFDGDRATVIRNYEKHYLPFKPSLRDRVPELRGKALACWCAPEACHGDVLQRLTEE
jgi:hypothetical protein